MLKPILLLVLLCSFNCGALEAKNTTETIDINGVANEAAWQLASWQPIDQLLVGTMPSKEDFQGRFKILWDEKQLYLLVEIIDDVLFDQHADPKHLYWDDDCLEIFIDEDASGGNHQFNYNAFAYHIALDNQAVDIGKNTADGKVNFVLLNDHLTSVWQRNETAPYTITWEVSLQVYNDQFSPNSSSESMVLFVGKKLGFMLAYCDNDGSATRESFMNSTAIKAVNGDKNRGYITADVFEKLTLIQ